MGREEKLKKFERIAEKRVSDLIRRIRLLGNLSNRSNYDYSDTHVRRIYQVLEKELKLSRERFSIGRGSTSAAFTFKR
jgi:uncharacterized protein YeeX (DUF496 family)